MDEELLEELERGEVRFFVRPRVELEVAETLADVQRFFALLRPFAHDALARRLAVGKKRMPDPERHEREWAYIDRVGESFDDLLEGVGPSTYETKTHGARWQAGAIEVARGTYLIAEHGTHAHFAYALDEGIERTPLLDELNLDERGSYIAAVFNPEAKGRGRWRARDAAGDGAPFSEPSFYPEELQEKFRARRFAPLEPTFLDYEGTEIVLIGGGHASRIVSLFDERSRQEGREREEEPAAFPGHPRAAAGA